MEEYKQAILDYVIKEYLEDDDDDEITFDTELLTGVIDDSFSMLALQRFLENKYEIQIQRFHPLLLSGRKKFEFEKE